MKLQTGIVKKNQMVLYKYAKWLHETIEKYTENTNLITLSYLVSDW